MAEGSDKIFRRSEVAKYNDTKNAKIIIHNNVYDVTGFFNEHPGGEEVLLEQAGKDASDPFEDIGHSSDAREMMKKYKVGELHPVEVQVATHFIHAFLSVDPDFLPKSGYDDRKETTEKTRDWSNSKSEDDQGSWKSWMIPVSLAILATILYRMYFIGSSH